MSELEENSTDSSSSEMINLRNSCHGEIIRVCMGIFTKALIQAYPVLYVVTVQKLEIYIVSSFVPTSRPTFVNTLNSIVVIFNEVLQVFLGCMKPGIQSLRTVAHFFKTVSDFFS